jgi:hypothetical protein
MNILRLCLAVLAVGLAAWLVQQPGLQSAPPPPRQFDQPLPALYGMALQVDVATGLIDRYTDALREIAELGSQSVLVSFNLYQEHAGSEHVGPHPEYTPQPDELRALLQMARALRLRVILMPKVLLSAPRGKEWRGKIKPPSWDAWFDQYRRQMVDIAEIAEETGVDVFLVGSELVTTEKFTDKWKKIIADVRGVFSGRIGYSANWDHYKNIEYWDDLDLIGLTTYYKLADEPGPSVETLVESWKPIKKKILSWQQSRNRPILFTEVGWCSQEGAAIEAWNYYRSSKCTPAALEEQKNCYEAFIESWGGEPAVGGVIWWEWTIYPGGQNDYNYTPRGKPAEQVLRSWFASKQSAGGSGDTAFEAPKAEK